MIDHAFYATNLNIQRNSQVLSGKLVDINGKKVDLSPPNQVGEEVNFLYFFLNLLFFFLKNAHKLNREN